jgi:PAS domain S-box-containing protein
MKYIENVMENKKTAPNISDPVSPEEIGGDMTASPLYNSRIIKNWVEYLKKYYPDIDMNSLLNYSNIKDYELDDEGHWLTQKQVDRFHEMAASATDDPDISRAVGRFMVSSQSSGAVKQYLLGFINPETAYAVIEKLNASLSRAVVLKTKSLGVNSIEVKTTLMPNVAEKPYQCLNRLGALEAVAKPLTGKYANIEHTTCIHKGGDCCRYIISWEKTRPFFWKQIRNYSSIFGFISSILSFNFIPLVYWNILVLSFVLIVVGATLYTEHLEKEELLSTIHKQGDAAGRLVEQIDVSYNITLLVQEIGQATSIILDINKLLTFIVEALEKRLDFDRGMIMMANPEGTRLVYTTGFGYNPEQWEYLENIEFRLDNPASRGIFVVSFRTQTPFLVNNIDEIVKDFSPRSAEFAKRMGTHSFICVPIAFKGESLGILVVDNIRSKRLLRQSDMSLLMGIAPQIAISINNAMSYRKIMESEKRFRSLSESSPDIIYTLDMEGVFTYVNPAFERILGHRIEDVLGKHFIDFFKKEEISLYSTFFQETRDKGRIVQKDVIGTLLHKDGSDRFFSISGAPNLNAVGEMTGIVGTLKDVTEQRKLEYQLRHASKMNALGRLTGGISHDFNNILQAISAYNQLLTMKKTEADPDWKYLTNIDSLTKRATDLIKQLLIFSRKVDSKLVPVNMNREIKNYYELLVSTLPKTITIRLNLADDLHLINGDATQLGQVIMNLAVNAKDAMPAGGELSIETKNIDLATPMERDNVKINTGHYVLCRISDMGCGIEKENLDQIFEPFFTTKEAGKGTGIGLSVVYGVIKNHDGYIFCTSEPGKGTTFELYLPTLDVMTIEEKMETGKKPDLSKGQETILLVDDEPSLLETGQELLSFLGYNVLTATSGESALVTINREGDRIGIVIMDLMMPGMGGEKCLVEIRKIFPSMKVMITSGNITSVKTEDIMNAGASAFIQKPYYIEEMSKKVRDILDDAG